MKYSLFLFCAGRSAGAKQEKGNPGATVYPGRRSPRPLPWATIALPLRGAEPGEIEGPIEVVGDEQTLKSFRGTGLSIDLGSLNLPRCGEKRGETHMSKTRVVIIGGGFAGV